MSAPEVREWWVHRLTRSDGQIELTRLRKSEPGHACFAGISQRFARRRDPGATVEHVVLARIEVVA